MPTNKPTSGDGAAEPITLDLPETLEGLTDDELAAASQLRRDTFLGLRDGSIELNAGETVVEVGTQIAAQLDLITAESARRSEARVAETAALDEISARIIPVVEPEVVAPEVIVPEVVAEVTPIVQHVEPPVVNVEEALPIAAAATSAMRPISVRPRAFSTDTAPASVEVVAPATNPLGLSLTASVDYNLGRAGGNRQVMMGNKINLDDLALMAAEAHRTSGTANNEGSVYLGRMDLPFEDDLTLGDDALENGVKFEKLIRRLNEPETVGMTAAAVCGHCIPAPRILEFCDISSVDGLLELPTMRADRGGLQWVQSPTLADWMTKTNGLFWTTTDDCNVSATKTVVTVDCPGMQAVCEVEGHYLSVRFKNMAMRSWPELYRHNLGLAMKAHAYQQNLRNIAHVLAFQTGATISLPDQPDGAFAVLMRAIELAVVDSRDRYMTDLGFNFEVVLPTWIRPLLRSDLARRNGVDVRSISNAEINSEFVTRGARVQFIRGWQGLGASTPATSYPTDVDFLLFPAGALVQIDQGTLDLGMEIRDNASNAKNEFGGFVEDFSNVCHPCFDIRRYSLAVCDNGATGLQVEIPCD